MIYSGTPSSENPARRFLVYLWLLCWDKDDVRDDKDLLPQEFLAEILQELMVNGRPRKRDMPHTFIKMDQSWRSWMRRSKRFVVYQNGGMSMNSMVELRRAMGSRLR